MTAGPLASRTRQRAVEPVLAVLTVAFTAIWILEPAVVFGGGSMSPVAGYVFVLVSLLAPGLLSVSVLVRVARHGWRLASTYARSRNRLQDGDTALLHLAGSLVFGGLAAYTLWWVVASVYVLYIADVGGVMLAHVVALVAGSVLGLLLIGREGLRLGYHRASRLSEEHM